VKTTPRPAGSCASCGAELPHADGCGGPHSAQFVGSDELQKQVERRWAKHVRRYGWDEEEDELADKLVASRDPSLLPGWDNLPRRQREVTVLMHRHGGNAQRVADERGVSRRTVMDDYRAGIRAVVQAQKSVVDARETLGLPWKDTHSDREAMREIFGESVDLNTGATYEDDRPATIRRSSKAIGIPQARRTTRLIRKLTEYPIAEDDLFASLAEHGVPLASAVRALRYLLHLDKPTGITCLVSAGVRYYVRRARVTTKIVDELPPIVDDRPTRRARAGEHVHKRDDLSYRQAMDPCGKTPKQPVTMPSDDLGPEDAETSDPDDDDQWVLIAAEATDAYDALSRRRPPTEAAVIKLLARLVDVSEATVRRLVSEHPVEWDRLTAEWEWDSPAG
jgi:DNA-directed RNA polymerase specialized sigma24 family protein